MPDQWLGDLFAVSAAFCWAITVIFLRLGGLHMPPIPMKWVQNCTCILLFFSTLLVLDLPLTLSGLTYSEWCILALSAFLGITASDLFYVASLNRVGAATQALLDITYAPFAIFFAFALYSQVIQPIEAIGGLVIIAAILFGGMTRAKQAKYPVSSGKDYYLGIFFGVLTQACAASAVILVIDLMKNHEVVTLVAYRYIFGTLFMIPLALKPNYRRIWWSGFGKFKGWIWVHLASVLGPFLATLFWFAGYKYTLAGRAAIYNQMSSIFLWILAALILKERLGPRGWIALFLALTGALIIS